MKEYIVELTGILAYKSSMNPHMETASLVFSFVIAQSVEIKSLGASEEAHMIFNLFPDVAQGNRWRSSHVWTEPRATSSMMTL